MEDEFYPYEILINSYPRLYSYCKYIECGRGWYELIDNLSKKLEQLITKMIKDPIPEGESEEYPCAIQVKEKYGKLRFYMSSVTDEMDKLIEEAEEESAFICEKCGNPGQLEYDKWISCLCDECREKMDKIKCPKCGNEDEETLFQHDRSLAGYGDYGRNFTCLGCARDFHITEDIANDHVIMRWPDV